jgi:class 3 adenylate cyclase
MSPYARIDHEMPESTGASLRTIIEGGGGSVARVEGHAVMAWFDASDAAVETWLDLVDASRRGQCGPARGGVAWGPTGDASHSIDVARRAADLAELAGPGELYTTMELLDVISSDQARYTVESLGDEQPKLYRLRAVG